MLLFMRHAERGDNQNPPILSEVEFDPPIIQESLKTIQSSAQEIAAIFKQNQIKKFKIISSRFLRCLMTSQVLSNQLKKYGFQQCQNPKINDLIGQYMRPDWFSNYPIKDLIFNQHNFQHLKKYLQFPSKWMQQTKDHQTPFPQNYGHFHYRVKKFQTQLKYPPIDQCLILVTHGFVVRQMCMVMNQLPDYRDQIKYCGYAIYKHNGKKDILIQSKL